MAPPDTSQRSVPDGGLFRAIVEHGVGPLFVIDPNGAVIMGSPALARMLEVSESALVGRMLDAFVHPDDATRIKRGCLEASEVVPHALTCRLGTASGTWLHVELLAIDLRQDPSVQGFIVTVRDMTHQSLADEALAHAALHDPLTGLPNRALLLDRLGQALARSDRHLGRTAVLFLDLDNFKVINDSLGHLAGDLLLIELAHRLLVNLRQGDTVARFGGDEFAVLVEEVSDVDEAVATADRLMSALRSPVLLDGRQVTPDVSVGIALSAGNDDQPEDVLRKADLAMYQAKAAGKGRYAVFEVAMQARADARLELETGLRYAVEHGELRVHFQPVFSLEDSRITGFEALARWARPGYGVVPPSEFIPIAEETGLIVPIGQWVLEESCRRLKRWQQRYSHAGDLAVSVNMSPRQLRHPELVRDVARTLRETDVDPAHVTLEITESALVDDAAGTIRLLHELKAVGVQLAIDDFGTGYSSLSYLRRLPVDVLKIDRSFVNSLGEHERNDAVVRGIFELADTLKLTTTAEGIETQTQLATIRRLGGSSGQGFLFARPLSPEDIDVLLERSSGHGTFLRAA